MTAELNTSCGINVSTETVHRELQGMAFHDQAALVGVIRGRIALCIMSCAITQVFEFLFHYRFSEVVLFY